MKAPKLSLSADKHLVLNIPCAFMMRMIFELNQKCSWKVLNANFGYCLCSDVRRKVIILQVTAHFPPLFRFLVNCRAWSCFNTVFILLPLPIYVLRCMKFWHPFIPEGSFTSLPCQTT